MLPGAEGTEDTEFFNTGLTEITERNCRDAIHGDELDRRGNALRAAGLR
jgi:hypothetical protein